MKRKGDEERQVSKESYFANEDKEVVIDFSKAKPEVLESRRMVTALRQPDKKEAFCQHVEILNRSFFEWFKEQIEKNPSYELSDAFQVRSHFRCGVPSYVYIHPSGFLWALNKKTTAADAVFQYNWRISLDLHLPVC